MQLIRIRLVSPDYPRPTETDAQTVHDAIRARAPADVGLEHVRARADGDGIDMVLYFRDPEPLEYRASQRIATFLATVPAMTQWHVSPSHY